jgi:hypothetical protein
MRLPANAARLCVALMSCLAFATWAAAQQPVTDPGVRGGDPDVGGGRAGLTSNYSTLFTAALARFQEVNSVSGNLPGSDSQGLGPRYNGDSCAGCHVQPAIGGTSPNSNPEIAFATIFGATNTVPSFVKPDGPVREARFVRNPDGTPDGGVHDLFVITNMKDAPGCNIAQPDFAGAVEANNVIFRIPTPVFGLGLVEEIVDANILANMNAHRDAKADLGIGGRPNRNGNDGTITRFGWKAQNKSALIFAGEPTTSRWASPTSCSLTSARTTSTAASTNSPKTPRTSPQTALARLPISLRT